MTLCAHGYPVPLRAPTLCEECIAESRARYKAAQIEDAMKALESAFAACRGQPEPMGANSFRVQAYAILKETFDE